MELSTYFRINAANTGQFERTLIICESRAQVSTWKAVPRRCAMKTSSRRGGRARCADDAYIKILHRAELVPRR